MWWEEDDGGGGGWFVFGYMEFFSFLRSFSLTFLCSVCACICVIPMWSSSSVGRQIGWHENRKEVLYSRGWLYSKIKIRKKILYRKKSSYHHTTYFFSSFYVFIFLFSFAFWSTINALYTPRTIYLFFIFFSEHTFVEHGYHL